MTGSITPLRAFRYFTSGRMRCPCWWGGLTWGYRPIVDAFVERIVASRPPRVLCGALLVWSVAVQFVGAYGYSLMGWSDLWREYDRPEQASLWRWDRPQIGYHLANFSSERARKKQVMATYLNYPGPILTNPAAPPQGRRPRAKSSANRA